jgi:hypothetical protein
MSGRCSLRRVLIAPVLLLVLLGATVLAVSVSATDPVTTRTILSVQIADSPPPPAFLALVRTVLPQGTVNRNLPTEGVWFIAVEKGTLTLESPESNDGWTDGFARAADAPPSYRSSSANATLSQTVARGEAMGVTDPPAFTVGNAGADSSIYLEIILAPRATLGLVRHITMDLIVVEPLAIANVAPLPADPVEIRLDEVEIAGGTTFAIPASAGPRVVMVRRGMATVTVESGTITVRSDVGLDTPIASVGEQALIATKPVALNDRDEIVVQAGASGAVLNSGSEPVTLWVLSLVSVTKSTYSPGS